MVLKTEKKLDLPSVKSRHREALSGAKRCSDQTSDEKALCSAIPPPACPEGIGRVGAQNIGSVGRGFLTYPHPFSGQGAEQVSDPTCLLRQAQPHRQGRCAGAQGALSLGQTRPWPRSLQVPGPSHTVEREQEAFLGRERSGGGRRDFRPFLLSGISSGLRARTSYSDEH